MSTAKFVLALLVLFIALGIVGRMDYEDAMRTERISSKEAIRLSCVRVPIDASGERSRSKPERATAILAAISAIADVEAPAPTVLRCVVVED
jgi:hypothetical protein